MIPKTFVIVGGGIIGSTVAREILTRKIGRVTILEKENHLGEHASGRNSGVIHSGINQKPGSIKARMCLEGSKRLRDYCKSYNVPLKECGTIVVAQNPAEEAVLNQLIQMGKEVGVEDLRILTKWDLHRMEPSVVGTKALLSPSGAVVDSLLLLRSVSEEVKWLGGEYVFSAKVIKITGNEVQSTQGKWICDHLINAAGLYSDEIAHMMGVGLDYTIIPFRGEYMEVKDIPVHSMVYQAPNLKYPFLSVHLTKMVDGKVLAGPTATLSLGRESYRKEWNIPETVNMMRTENFWKMVGSGEFLKLAVNNAKVSLFKDEFLKEIQKLCPQVSKDNILPYRSGIRAQMVDKEGRMLNDIIVKAHANSTHILNAVSPGMTSSLAFAEYVVNQIPS